MKNILKTIFKKNNLLAFTISLSLSFISCKKSEEVSPTPNTAPTSAQSNEQKVQELFNVFVTGNTTGLKHISDAQYIQHNPYAPDGKTALASMFSGQPTGITVSNHRIFSEGNFVIAHTTYGGTWNSGTPQVAFDVFRFDNGLIVEHWDNLQNVTNPITDTTNLNTQTNGTTVISNSNITVNKVLVKNMVDSILIAGKWSTRANYFSNTYIQHSPSVPNGINWMGMFPDGTPFYSSLKYVYGSGDFVLAMSEGPEFVNNTPTGNQKAYFDLFRIENGKIAEHWDAVSVIPPTSQWANSNGKW